MKLGNDKKAGLLIFAGVGQFTIVLPVAEALYQGYSLTKNGIDALGVGSTAGLFNGSVVVLGLCLLLASYYMEKVFTQWQHSLLLFVLGIGAIGFGVFAVNQYLFHEIFALMAFVVGAFSAIYSYKIERPPVNYVSLVLGLTALTALFFVASGSYFGLGQGGMELLVLYPILMWGFVFSGYLMSGKAES